MLSKMTKAGWLFASSLVLYAFLMLRQTTDPRWIRKEPAKRRGVARLLPETEVDACEPARKVVYVKTHKTASSTVHKILTRFIPSQVDSFPKPYFGGYPAPFQRRFLRPRKNKHNNSLRTVTSLSGHFRYNPAEIRSVVGKSCKHITIIRNPVRQFESSFYYYYRRFTTFLERFGKVSCFGEPYVQVTGRMGVDITSYLEMANRSLNDSMAWFFRSKNYQSFDLGMDPKLKTKSAIRKYVRKLDATFDLVMISDYFLESLILLKDTMCMSWEDIIPRRFAQQGHYEKKEFTSHELKLIRNVNNQDFVLFDHFNRTFWKKVSVYGTDRMRRDVNALRAMIESSRSTEQESEEEEDARVRARARRNMKIDGTSIFTTPKTRTEHIELLKTRIVNECGRHKICKQENTVHEIAEAMVDNNGWCPH